MPNPTDAQGASRVPPTNFGVFAECKPTSGLSRLNGKSLISAIRTLVRGANHDYQPIDPIPRVDKALAH